jgi:hypothetical protein
MNFLDRLIEIRKKNPKYILNFSLNNGISISSQSETIGNHQSVI